MKKKQYISLTPLTFFSQEVRLIGHQITEIIFHFVVQAPNFVYMCFRIYSLRKVRYSRRKTKWPPFIKMAAVWSGMNLWAKFWWNNGILTFYALKYMFLSLFFCFLGGFCQNLFIQSNTICLTFRSIACSYLQTFGTENPFFLFYETTILKNGDQLVFQRG